MRIVEKTTFRIAVVSELKRGPKKDATVLDRAEVGPLRILIYCLEHTDKLIGEQRFFYKSLVGTFVSSMILSCHLYCGLNRSANAVPLQFDKLSASNRHKENLDLKYECNMIYSRLWIL